MSLRYLTISHRRAQPAGPARVGALALAVAGYLLNWASVLRRVSKSCVRSALAMFRASANFRTALSVNGPAMPSTGPGSKPAVLRRFCSSRILSPPVNGAGPGDTLGGVDIAAADESSGSSDVDL